MKCNKSLLVFIFVMLVSCTQNKNVEMMRQSPINLESTKAVVAENIEYLQSKFENVKSIEDTGHDLKIYLDGITTLKGQTYKALQMHFHNTSEHTLDGKYYPIEGHIVHQNVNDPDDLLVIGVFYDLGAENASFEAILNNFIAGSKIDVKDKNINIDSLVPTGKSYFHYLGSLTTPPYSENVSWYVMSTPVSISADQLERHNIFYSNNFRELQKLNNRTVSFTK